MAEHRFRAYVQFKEPWSDNLRDFVDFVVDPARDAELPDATSWEPLEAHLVSREASQHAIESAKHIWGLYEVEVLGKTD